MRVVAGSLRGRRIVAPAGSATRPTTDKVREATFNAFQASRYCAGETAEDILVVATTLLEVNEQQLARTTLGFIDPDHPANAGCLLDLGRLYSVLEDQENALRCIRAARAAGGDGAFIAHMESIVLSFLGPIGQSIAACEESVAKAPGYGHAHWSCAQPSHVAPHSSSASSTHTRSQNVSQQNASAAHTVATHSSHAGSSAGPGSHTPCSHATAQSCGHDSGVSPGSHAPLPHVVHVVPQMSCASWTHSESQ